MSYINQNLSEEQLRTLFIRISNNESWFTADYDVDDPEEHDEYDAGESNFNHIELLFGPPPWVFLQPGDAPERFVNSNRLGRKTVRNPSESTYKAMRGSTVNYSNLPKHPQFVTSPDPSKAHHLWVPGTDPKVVNRFDLYQNLEQLQRETDGTVGFSYKRPKGSKVDHIAVSDLVILYTLDKKTKETQAFCQVSVSTIFLTRGAATAKMTGMVHSFYG